MSMQQPQAASLSEQELLNDLLNQEKQLIGSYATFITEASCPNLRTVLTDTISQTMLDQYNVFDQMRQRGYYAGKDAPDQDVTQVKQQAQQMSSTVLQ